MPSRPPHGLRFADFPFRRLGIVSDQFTAPSGISGRGPGDGKGPPSFRPMLSSSSEFVLSAPSSRPGKCEWSRTLSYSPLPTAGEGRGSPGRFPGPHRATRDNGSAKPVVPRGSRQNDAPTCGRCSPESAKWEPGEQNQQNQVQNRDGRRKEQLVESTS